MIVIPFRAIQFFESRFVATFSMACKGCWACSASIMRREVNDQKRSRLDTTAKIAFLRDFDIYPLDPEISADGQVRQRTLSLLPERTNNIATILGEIPG
jgi:hypothetical protein